MTETPPCRPGHTPSAKPRAPAGRLNPYRWSLSYRCFAWPAVANRSSAGRKRPNSSCCLPITRRPCRSIKARRIHAPLAVAPASAGMRPDASGRKSPSGGRSFRHLSVHGPALANAENKTPPDEEPEGVRVASGDRGDRSPRGEDQSMGWKRPPFASRIPCTHGSTSRQSREGSVLAWMTNDMANATLIRKYISPEWRGREHYASPIIDASTFLTATNNSYSQPFCLANR